MVSDYFADLPCTKQYYENRSLDDQVRAFGFNLRVEAVDKAVETGVQSAFLKANTRNELMVIETDERLTRNIPPGQVLKIKIEVDTDPPSGFATTTRFLLQPIPFSVRCYTLPSLFAGKLHALLFRRWNNRVKGRDWYDLVCRPSSPPEPAPSGTTNAADRAMER